MSSGVYSKESLVPSLVGMESDVGLVCNPYQPDSFEGLMKAVNGLPSKHREVIVLRFGLHGGGVETLSRVAKLIGVTKERVRQIEAHALRKMRNHDSVEIFQDEAESCGVIHVQTDEDNKARKSRLFNRRNTDPKPIPSWLTELAEIVEDA